MKKLIKRTYVTCFNKKINLLEDNIAGYINDSGVSEDFLGQKKKKQ